MQQIISAAAAKYNTASTVFSCFFFIKDSLIDIPRPQVDLVFYYFLLSISK